VNSPDRAELTAWVTGFVADVLGVDPAQVPPGATLAELGIDSAAALVLAADLSEFARVRVRPVDVLDNPTVPLLVGLVLTPGALEVT
jgi:acyl carrier protein